MPDLYFEGFPAEILLNIVSQLTDLESLISLLRASPHVWRFFDTFGLEVTEKILNSSPLDEQIVIAIRTNACIRAGCFPISSISELQEHVTCEAIKYQDPPGALVPTSLPKTSSKVLRGILATAHRLNSLMLDCLQLYLERLRKLRPAHVRNHNLTMEMHLVTLVRALNPAAHPHEREIQFDPPSCLEEQRILRALWRIQLLTDLNAALTNNIVTGWSSDGIERLKNMTPVQIYRLSELSDVLQSDDRYDDVAQGGLLHSLAFVETSEYSMILLVSEYLEERLHAPSRALVSSRPNPWLATQPQGWDLEEMDRHFNPTFEDLAEIFDQHLLRDVLFASYRKLGFAIWDQYRMQCYGMNRCDENRSQTAAFSWYVNVLPEEDRARVEKW